MVPTFQLKKTEGYEEARDVENPASWDPEVGSSLADGRNKNVGNNNQGGAMIRQAGQRVNCDSQPWPGV